MADFPPQIGDWETTAHIISTPGVGCPAGEATINSGSAFNAVTAWTTGNQAIYTMVHIPFNCWCYGFIWVNGATSAGNIDVGVFGENGTKFASTGAVAQGTVSAVGTANAVTPVRLSRGVAFLGASMSGTTGIVMSSNIGVALLRLSGVASQTTAHPLPATASFGSLAISLCPYIGMAVGNAVF